MMMMMTTIITVFRARKPSAQEKDALNIAFLLTPLVSIAMPVATKDVAVIWWANAGTVLLCYVYAFFIKKSETATSEVVGDDDDSGKRSPVQRLLLQAFKALDYGSGQERGLRK
jgi:hypothetical protein